MNATQAAQRKQPEQELLAALKIDYPQVCRGRWKETLLQRLSEFKCEDMDPDSVASVLQAFKFVPDAFVYRPEDLEIDLFEVEITSVMRPAKLDAYARLVTDLHTYGIGLNLYTVNQHGHINQVDLLNHYMRQVLNRGPE